MLHLEQNSNVIFATKAFQSSYLSCSSKSPRKRHVCLFTSGPAHHRVNKQSEINSNFHIVVQPVAFITNGRNGTLVTDEPSLGAHHQRQDTSRRHQWSPHIGQRRACELVVMFFRGRYDRKSIMLWRMVAFRCTAATSVQNTPAQDISPVAASSGSAGTRRNCIRPAGRVCSAESGASSSSAAPKSRRPLGILRGRLLQ